MKHNNPYPILWLLMGLAIIRAHAQNPIIRNQFTADLSARIFGD
jgi:hypothetical protein